MNQTNKKINVDVRNIQQMVEEEIYKSKYLKIVIYFGAGVLGLFALGFVLRAVNYTAHNFKNLNATLKR